MTLAIDGLKDPTNVTDIMYLLMLCNVFKLSIPNVSRLSAPPYKKLRKFKQYSFRNTQALGYFLKPHEQFSYQGGRWSNFMIVCPVP